MTSKELRRMGREKLLQLLIERTAETEELKTMLAQKEQEILQLREARVTPEPLAGREAGSIAQAALHINQVFEAAQKAADQYLDEIARMKQEQSFRCQQLLDDAQAEADHLIAEAKHRAEELQNETARRCDELHRIAEQSAQHNWDELCRRMDQLCDSNAELRSMLAPENKKRNWHR